MLSWLSHTKELLFGVRSLTYGFPKVFWVLLAVISCLFVTVLNGVPLYYFDSVAYLENGMKVLQVLGLTPDPSVTDAGMGAGHAADRIVNGSRSVFYSAFVSASAYFLGALTVPLTHFVIVFVVTLFLVHILLRCFAPAGVALMQAVALALGAASLGSLSFFVAYFMPDILAGMMILSIATLTLARPTMAWWEIVISMQRPFTVI